MADDANFYRERADAERVAAAATALANVRERALRSLERWEELAIKAEHAAAGAADRVGRSKAVPPGTS